MSLTSAALVGTALISTTILLVFLFGPRLFADIVVFTLGHTFGVLLGLIGLS